MSVQNVMAIQTNPTKVMDRPTDRHCQTLEPAPPTAPSQTASTTMKTLEKIGRQRIFSDIKIFFIRHDYC